MKGYVFRFISQIRGSGNTWCRVLSLFWSVNARMLLFLLILMILLGLIPALEVQLTRNLMQEVQLAIIGHGKPELVWMAMLFSLAQAGVALVLVLLNTHREYFEYVFQLQTFNHLSILIMEKAVTLELEHFEDDQLYDRLQSACQDIRNRPSLVVSGLLAIISQTISVISVAAVLLYWCWWIGLLILLAPVPSLCSQIFFARKRYRVERERLPILRRFLYLQDLVTTANSVKEVRLFRLGQLFLSRYREGFLAFFRMDRGLAKKRAVVTTPLEVLSYAIAAGAQIYALLFAISSGNIGLGLLAGFIQAITLMQTNTTSLLTSVSRLYENRLFLYNLFEFLDVSSRQPCHGSKPFPAHLRRGIEFRHVSFRYPGTERLILQDVSFSCHAGECVALVGANGAGKTTIVKLLTRLYEPTEGEILIDGVPIEEYNLDDLHKHIGTIFQDFVQYEMKVAENIGFGKLEDRDNREHIERAGQASGADVFVKRLPRSYESLLGRMFEKGEQLSIGQWQKIALARAFMSQAPIVVLDEPTASIDAEAEAEIFERFAQVAKESTTLLIAHRFSTVRMADRILVLEDGRLREEGTHESLMCAQGLYAHLFSLQAAGYSAS